MVNQLQAFLYFITKKSVILIDQSKAYPCRPWSTNGRSLLSLKYLKFFNKSSWCWLMFDNILDNRLSATYGAAMMEQK